MAKLRDLVSEQFATGAIGAGSIAGVRGALFTGAVTRNVPAMDTLIMSPYAKTDNPLTRKKRQMKVNQLKESGSGEDFNAVTTSALRDMLRDRQRDTELKDTTQVFALEDSDGGIVKVYVKKDQAEDFKRAIEQTMADEGEEKEIAEILFDLHKSFDIVSVDWGQDTIPEDEEVANAKDAEEKGFPNSDELGDVEAETQGDADQASDDFGAELDGDLGDDLGGDMGGDDLGAPAGADVQGQVDQTKMLTQIISLLQAQADAQRAKADADKAKADIEAAEAAARAAAHYTSYQEEVMDMENYNKRKQEERRENQIQAKLIRYRHDLRKDNGKSLQDKLDDPEHLLNTLHRASIGESVKHQPATPEEEEILHMEDWEKAEKAKKQDTQLRDRLIRYRHGRKKVAAQSQTQQESQENKEFDPKTGSLMDYLLHKKQHASHAEHHSAND